jgi:type IX secretion system PorP/SprF family membrane protein
MLKMRHFIIVLLSVVSVNTFAQQEPQLTHFMFNQLSFNPAYAGVRDAICSNILARQQWVGFTDGEDKVFPQTNLFTIDAPINKINSGLGLMFMTDKLGFEENLQIRLNYAYKFNIGLGRMSVGASVGFLDKTIDFSKFKPLDDGDPVLAPQGKESDMMMDFAFGVFYNVQDMFYIGLSASQLAEDDFSGTLTEVPYSLSRHYYLTGGYYFNMPNPSWVINPNLLVKSDLGSTQVDLNVLGIYNNKLWGGVSYRAFDAACILLGAYPFDQGVMSDFKVGYSYDVTTSKLGRGGRSNGSHEIFAAYCFKIIIPRIPSSYSNVRYLPTL